MSVDWFRQGPVRMYGEEVEEDVPFLMSPSGISSGPFQLLTNKPRPKGEYAIRETWFSSQTLMTRKSSSSIDQSEASTSTAAMGWI